MQRKRETRPSRQAGGRETRSAYMVAQPERKLTRGDAWLMLAMAIATFAFITWHEAGAAPAILGAITSAAILAALDFAFKGEWS